MVIFNIYLKLPKGYKNNMIGNTPEHNVGEKTILFQWGDIPVKGLCTLWDNLVI